MDESLTTWQVLPLLLAIEEEGSLRGAASRTGLSQPTLGRRVRNLEDDLGRALLIRHARGVSFTDDGRAVLEVAREVQERVDALLRGLSGREDGIRGRVRISCTEPVAIDLLPPTLARLRQLHPEVSIDVVVDAHASDLDRREADIAIRMFQPQRASLVARRVGASFTGFFASHDYIRRHGAPASVQDLLGHEVVGPDRDRMFVEMAQALGFSLDEIPFRTDSFAVTQAWTRAGLCIGALEGATADRDPTLQRILEPLAEYPVWLVTHPDLFASAAIRAVWEALAVDLAEVFGGVDSVDGE